MFALSVVLLAGTAAAYPPLLRSRGDFSGIATFNSYGSQSSTVCGPLAGQAGTYGAAASDISPDISGGKCSGTADSTQCNGYGPPAGFQPPQCPKTNCGKCYRVTNQGGIGGGSVGGIGNAVTVQIIDSCPSSSGQNFCKKNVPANQRCGDPSTNQLDIDQSAYVALTGQPFGGGPTLKISIAPWDCGADPTVDPGSTGGSTGGSSSSVVSAAPSSATSSAVATATSTGDSGTGGGIQPVGSGNVNPGGLTRPVSFLETGSNSTNTQQTQPNTQQDTQPNNQTNTQPDTQPSNVPFVVQPKKCKRSKKPKSPLPRPLPRPMHKA